MDAAEIRRLVLEELQRIAPELEPEQLRGDRPLRDEVDLDSMDWLRLLSALHQRLGVNIPEADYRRLDSLDALVAYLARRV
ncbi:acyl carrier protein [Pseudomonas sp. AOB-7]|uniref:acyl carrier protein n=1 Tax=Pseudomonas sp. AOB-7 TaxID=2482750 RepID=UPI000EFD8379|nr:acyl carrier protein [Pseudomonas sp. AOB-7]RMH85912.1 acyl carrier protein [Pseudomonas sp. AOB-7]